MKYLYIVLRIVALQVFFMEASATEHSTEVAAKTAPAVIEMPAAVPVTATVTPDTQRLVKEPVKIVQDTVLPPCDIIFFKSGKLEYCKVIQTDPATISYKMCDYPDGPTIIVNKSTVHKIRYANGKEEIITVEQQQQQQANRNAYVKGRKDPLATLSFIFGLVSAGLVVLVGIVFIPLALAGIILGIISLAKMARRRGEFRGKGSAIIGIILCALVLLLLGL